MNRPPRIRASRSSRASVAAFCALAAVAALAATADNAQIFKCTDASGNVTYQNEPCPKNSKAGQIDIFDNRWSASRDEREAEWRRNAQAHRLVTGMPARFVREALGEPTEVRDTPTAGAAQLWLYNLPDRSVQVGMLDDQVLWFRETPVASSAPRVAAPPGSAAGAAPQSPSTASQSPSVAQQRPSGTAVPERPVDLPVARLTPQASERAIDAERAAPAADRGAIDTRGAAATPPTAANQESAPAAPASAKTPRPIARGQDCRQALADLGPPDRQREVPAFDASSDPATEYFYESSSTGRLKIVCSNGRVEGVDRSVAR